jgi:phage shock protein PspC (stress-responsive transcriptional regulator)
VRRATNRLIAGVAGGLADRTQIRPIWFRVGFAALALAGGMGVFAYLLCWFLIPRADLPNSAGQRFAAKFPDAPAWLGVALLMLGAVLLAGQLGLWTPSVGWAFLLIGLGVVLYRRDAERRGLQTGTAAPGDAPSADDAGAIEAPVAPTSMLPSFVRQPRAPRERAWLGWLTVGLAMTGTGIAAITRDAHTAMTVVFAVPLAILGAGLLAGTIAGRARWTILLGLPLIPLVAVTTILPVSPFGDRSSIYVHAKIGRELLPSYVRAGGNLVFDLERLPLAENTGPVSATVAVGEIQVWVPPCRGVTVTAHAGAGWLRLYRRDVVGLDVHDRIALPGSNPIEFQLDVGIGSISVTRVLSEDSICRNQRSRA